MAEQEDHPTGYHEACFDARNQTPARAIREALDAIRAVRKAFGPPGDYGYGTGEGNALRWLYDSTQLLAPVYKDLAAREAAEGGEAAPADQAPSFTLNRGGLGQAEGDPR